jgi:outer membrane protein insertion porin family
VASLKFLLLTTIFIFAAQTQAFGRTLDLQSLDNFTRENLLQSIPALKKNDFTLGDLEKAIKWLVEKSSFDSAAYSDQGNGHFVLKTGRTQRVHAVKITGNKSISEEDIRRAFGITEETIFDRESLLEAGERIRQYYRDQGFFNCVVDMEFQPYGKNDYDVVAKISENTLSRLSEVDIDTANSELQRKLQKILDKNKKSPFTPVLLKEMVKKIQNYFLDNHYFKAELAEPAVNFSKDESQVSVNFKIDYPQMYVIETPSAQNSILFSDVRDAIGLDHYSTTAPNAAREIENKIKAYYISQGYSRAEISVNDNDGTEPYHRYLTFNIVEGSKVRIDKVNFTGHMSRPEKHYVSLLKELSSPILASGIFVKDDLDKAVKNLIIDRQNSGYFRAKIISLRTSFNADHDRVNISINIDEGPITQIQKITFEGNNQIPERDLLEQLNLSPLEPLRLNQLESGIANIKKYYRDHGFLEMNLINEKNESENLVTYNEDDTLAILHFKIFEGPKVIVSSIVIEGNSITKDYVVLKEVEFKPGDVLTPAKIDESLARLQRLNLFTSVDIRTLEEKTMVSQRTVVVHVSDRDPGVYNFGAGATNELGFTLRGYAGVAYRNISGLARAISLRVDINDYLQTVKFLERRISAGYLEPYLFDTRLKFRTNFTDAVYIADYTRFLATQSDQADFDLEQEITSHVLVRWDVLNWTKYSTYQINGDPAYPPYNVDIGATGPTIELDYRDNPFSPTRGSYTKINLEYGDPLLLSTSNVNYWRATASYSYNWNIFRKVVWANMVRGGILQNLKPIDEGGQVPWLQKGFLLGGPTTIRGFTYAEAFPNVQDLGNQEFQLTTNASMYLIKSEVRFPIKGNIGAVLFFDGGAVVITGTDYLGSGFRDAAGFGVTYNTPVGAVSAELGWKLNQKTRIAGPESPVVFDLSIGSF